MLLYSSSAAADEKHDSADDDDDGGEEEDVFDEQEQVETGNVCTVILYSCNHKHVNKFMFMDVDIAQLKILEIQFAIMDVTNTV